jgi:DNA-binding MarR family transcriptional regulator
MSTLVSQLERMDLLERQSDPHDGRVVRVAITAAGQEHLSTLRRGVSSVFEILIDKLTPTEAAPLLAALPTFRRMLQLADDEFASEGSAT